MLPVTPTTKSTAGIDIAILVCCLVNIRWKITCKKDPFDNFLVIFDIN